MESGAYFVYFQGWIEIRAWGGGCRSERLEEGRRVRKSLRLYLSGNLMRYQLINSRMDSKIPPEFFFRHLEKVHQAWSNKETHPMDSIILVNGKGTGGNEKTVAIVSWFFAGYNLADTIIALSPKSIIIYASDRKVSFLSNLKADDAAKKHNLTFVAKTDDLNDSFKTIWADLHSNNPNPTVGMIAGDAKTGQIAEGFMSFMEAQPHSKLEVLNFFYQCFMSKDDEEVENLRKSSRVSGYFFSKFIKEVELVIDSGKPTKHSDLSRKILGLMENEGELKKCAIKLSSQKVSKDFIDLGAPCSIQSGGVYSSKLFIESNEKELKSDCIIISLGSMYRSYNTFISRTLLIDPNEEQKNIYKKIQTLTRILTQNLRGGVKISDVYKKARLFMQDSLPNIEVPKNFGYGMGIFLTQNQLAINETNDKVILPGFSFLLSINLPEIKFESKKGTSIFAIQIADNILVGEKGQDVLTAEVSKALTEISYSLEDEDEEGKKSKPKAPPSGQIIEGRRRKVLVETNIRLQNQKERTEHQLVLKKKKLEQLQQRTNQNFGVDFKKQKMIDLSKIECYRSKEDLPRDLKPKLIYIDNKNNAILLPINGSHVPFHICILKSVVKNDEGKLASLRFNFHLPNTVATLNFPKVTEPTVFVKEIVFRSQNVSRVAELERQVKALQKKVRLEMSEKHAKEDIVEQERLNLNKGKRPILRELYVRPGLGSKKSKGTLECHLNGFRYSTVKGETIDVAFSNIKYAFFQPCEKEIIAAIHFRLAEPIMMGKKKTEDIQFYSEGGVAAEDVVGRGRGEDSDDEERQKEIKRRIDRDFLAWTKACEEFIHKSFDFEIPNRNLGFYGTTFRSNVLLQPTKSCIINITESSFFVFAVEDIEVVWFQRMTGNVRYFDLTLVNKDYEHHVRINSISIKDVEKVKDWLDGNNIVFYDNKISLNWNKFLQGVRAEFKKFVEDGAWTAWDDADEDGDNAIDEDDSEFSASDQDLEDGSEDSEDSQSGQGDEAADSDDSGDDASDELSEEGLSWEQLEQKAEREDRDKLKRDQDRERDRENMKKRR